MRNKTLNCNGKLLDLSTPKIMAILNVGNNSFFDGGSYTQKEEIFAKVQQYIDAGCDIVDIGVTSSKPGENISCPDEEIKALYYISELTDKYPDTLFSIDTYHAKVARYALENGVHIVNDISGGELDDSMLDLIVEKNCPYIMMHMQGVPENMQNNPSYSNVVLEVIEYFQPKVIYLRDRGVKDIVIDPGFGFGKSVEHNYTLLKELKALKIFDVPLLVGVSRKSMIGKVLDKLPKDLLNGTSVLNLLALQNGADILRVHDVEEAKDVVKLFDYYRGI